MKRSIFVAVGLGAVIAAGLTLNRARIPSEPTPETVAGSVPEPVREESNAPTPEAEQSTPPAPIAHAVSRTVPQPAVPTSEGQRTLTPTEIASAYRLNMDTVLSPRSNYKQRQAAWKELKKLNQVDHAVSELEQRVADEPQSAEAASALGQAYLKQCEDLEEMRQQAILAMKADQLLETALKLDPGNWDARFTKAVGMSYWPAELNKGPEVIQEFRTLIEQQSTQPQQSYFAKPYLRLGDQYVKAGRPDFAAQVWQAGAALFPDNSDLKEKLSVAR